MPEPTAQRSVLQVEQGGLLWCMRTWVAGLQAGEDAGGRIERVFAGLGAPDAAPFLQGFMFAVGHGATRVVAVQCPCCPRLADDERMLLDAFGLAQEMRPFEALLLLRGLLSPEGARAALRSAEGVAAAMARAGCFLPAPAGDVQRYAITTGDPAP